MLWVEASASIESTEVFHNGDSPVTRYLFLVVGVVSVIVLGAIIFMRPDPVLDDSKEELKPDAKLEMYLNDRMDYSLRFSRTLAERRIRDAREIETAHPDLAPRAREVADSLRARLARNTYPD